MSASAFSTNDDVISCSLDCQSIATAKEDLFPVYELDRCVSWVQSSGFKRVALQFPDTLLVDAPAVASEIQRLAPYAKVFVLGDTSYSSCCVDEVAAEHYEADCIVHFGRACLSPTSKLPVLYVFGKMSVDIDDLAAKVKEVIRSDTKTVLVYDTPYSHAAGATFSALKSHFEELILSRLLDPSQASSVLFSEALSQTLPAEELTDFSVDAAEKRLRFLEAQACNEKSKVICKCGRLISLPVERSSIETYTFLFIGSSESPSLLNLMMTFNKSSFYTYNPASNLPQCKKEEINVNKALMKRYYLIEKAKDASIVGIVAGTLGVARYRDMIDHLKQLLKKVGKKSYTFVVGRLNPAKLANFAEVDVNVLVACPESSLIDQSQFYRPVISPLEMEFACNKARSWTGDYSTDFRELLQGSSNYIEAPAIQESEAADVSLISNKIRILGCHECPEVSGDHGQEVAIRSDSAVVANIAENAGQFLAGRSWQGLERKLGETPVVKATEGQHGIAASYQHEPS